MKILNILTILFFACSLNAQHLELGLSFGNANYLGDLVSTKNMEVIKQFNASTGIFGRINHKRWSGQLSIMHTTLQADDLNGLNPKRGLHFKTPLTEVALSVDCGLTYFKFNFGKSYIEPYITAGAAIYHFNPKALHNGQWVELQPLGTEGQGLEGYDDPYSRTQLALIAGGGIKYKLNEKIALRAELGFRKLFTDHLDDVSAQEFSYTDLYYGNGADVAALSVPNIKPSQLEDKEATLTRGGDAYDMYIVYQVSVAYTIGKDAKNNFYYR